MRYSSFGKTGLRISRVGFGAWATGGASRFGWSDVDDRDSIDAIHRATDLGVNWIDTAAFYGKGHSEEVVGRAVRGRRPGEDIFLFTKCGLRWSENDPDADPVNNLEPKSIRFECEQSLKRLGVEAIDLYQFHWPDELGTPVEESWSTMDELVQEGKIRFAGVSNFDVDLLERCEKVRHVDSLQPKLNLLEREAAEDVIPWCRDNGSGVLVYSPLASGLLTGKYDREKIEQLGPEDWRSHSEGFKEKAREALEVVERLESVGGRLGKSVVELAVAWTLSLEGVSAAIVGARNSQQVEGWIGAADIDLAAEDFSFLTR